MSLITEQLFLEDFLGWTNDQLKDYIIAQYRVDRGAVNKFNIIVAWGRGMDDCESSNFFLLQDPATGGLYENHASHCSCYGYEDQFKPEPTSLQYLHSDHFSPGYGRETDQIKEFVKTLGVRR